MPAESDEIEQAALEMYGQAALEMYGQTDMAAVLPWFVLTDQTREVWRRAARERMAAAE